MISRFDLASDLCDPLAMTVTHDNKMLVADRKAVNVYQIVHEYNAKTVSFDQKVQKHLAYYNLNVVSKTMCFQMQLVLIL